MQIPDFTNKYFMPDAIILHKNIKILEIHSDFIIGASGYKLKKYINGKWQYFSCLNDVKYSFLSYFRLLSRLLRAEIHDYITLRSGCGICIAKKAIFLENKTSKKFEKVFVVPRGSRPMMLCEDTEGNLFFGEYFDNKERNEVKIYSSFDNGNTWKIAYTFFPDTIRHIHGIQMDPFTGFIWITTGDEDGECNIALTKDKFKTLEIIATGGQEFRACNLLFLEDKIIYGTDSPYIQNFIRAISRNDFSIVNITKVQGSVINACRIGNKCIISTTVEPSKINKEKNSYIWISENGLHWTQIGCFRKDIYNITLFQYGNIRFPRYRDTDMNTLFFSGHALKKIDGHSIELKNLDYHMKRSGEQSVSLFELIN